MFKEEHICTYISNTGKGNIFLYSNNIIKSFFDECILELLDNQKYRALLSAYDNYLMEHSVNTAILTAFLALEQDLPKDIAKELVTAALFHDIGKLNIPKNILYKPDRLTEQEWAIMQAHPRIGCALIRPHKPSSLVLDVIRYHHTGFNGKGYPKIGARGCENWDLIQVVTLADAFDAMASKRSYRQRMPLSLIYNEIQKNLGKQFDPISGHFLLGALENMYPAKGMMFI